MASRTRLRGLLPQYPFDLVLISNASWPLYDSMARRMSKTLSSIGSRTKLVYFQRYSADAIYALISVLVLQRGFTLVGSSRRCGACDVRDTPHGFSAGDRPVWPAPTACQTREGARPPPAPAPPEATSPLALFFNRRLMRTTKKCARITHVL
jgi:hypothetical protein